MAERTTPAAEMVLLDFDETLGCFSAAVAFLITLAHVLVCDPFLKELELQKKKELLELAASQLIRKSVRPGLSSFMRILGELKSQGQIKETVVLTRAKASSQPLFAQLDTSPQQLLVDALLQMCEVDATVINRVVFSSLDKRKDLRLYKDQALFVLDDLPLEVNYDFDPKQVVHFFRIEPFFGRKPRKQDTTWLINFFDQLLRDKKTHTSTIPRALEDLLRQLNRVNARMRIIRSKFAMTTNTEPREIKQAQTSLLRACSLATTKRKHLPSADSHLHKMRKEDFKEQDSAKLEVGVSLAV